MLIFKVTLIATLLVSLLGILQAYLYGSVGRRMNAQVPATSAAESIELPPLTVIIPTHNQATALRKHLPSILHQDYERFEVIVIDMASTDETRDILERLEQQNAHLHHTFTPASARDISIERLALTLGFRAARYEWVVVTQPSCVPATPHWLTSIGEVITQPGLSLQSRRLKTPDMVLGIAHYDSQRQQWFHRKASFLRLWNSIANVQHILRGHTAVLADSCNLAFRKSYFLEKGGFAADHDLKTGALDLLVNHSSRPDNTALLLSPAALVIEDSMDSAHTWKKQRVFNAETHRHKAHTALFQFQQCCMLIVPWLMLLLLCVPLAATLYLFYVVPTNNDFTPLYILFAVTGTLWITYAVTKLKCFNKTAYALGHKKLYLTLFLFELTLPVWNISDRLSRRFTSRNEFRKKFV